MQVVSNIDIANITMKFDNFVMNTNIIGRYYYYREMRDLKTKFCCREVNLKLFK